MHMWNEQSPVKTEVNMSSSINIFAVNTKHDFWIYNFKNDFCCYKSKVCIRVSEGGL